MGDLELSTSATTKPLAALGPQPDCSLFVLIPHLESHKVKSESAERASDERATKPDRNRRRRRAVAATEREQLQSGSSYRA
jgi:hypothetical protein